MGVPHPRCSEPRTGQRDKTTSCQSQPEHSILACPHSSARSGGTNERLVVRSPTSHSLFSSLGSYSILCKKFMPNPFRGASSSSEHARFYPSLMILTRSTGKVQRAVDGVKILLDIAKESSDAFPPLKSALGCISALVNHYEVRT